MKNMEKTGHLAWCALVALMTAREDGLVESESQENVFITRWFAQVKKQRRFSRDVATDVDWILNQGRTLGVRARLRYTLDYLWRSCTGELSEQNDLFRLTCALELAKQYDWVYHVLSDSEWSGRRQIKPSASVNSICLLKSALDNGFNDDGTQVMPVTAIIGGRIDGLNALLKTCGWEAVSNDEHWKLVAINVGKMESGNCSCSQSASVSTNINCKLKTLPTHIK